MICKNYFIEHGTTNFYFNLMKQFFKTKWTLFGILIYEQYFKSLSLLWFIPYKPLNTKCCFIQEIILSYKKY